MAIGQPPLWLWQDLQQALNLEQPAVVDQPVIQGITFDSRKVQPNDLFVALPGDPGPGYNVSHRSDRDGHHFIEAAVANGAVAALTHDGAARILPQLAVADTLEGLQQLAAYRRHQAQAQRIAITGSSGKTTAKTLLAAALRVAAGADATHASQGSFNNHLGVPLSLATMPIASTYGVFEIGTNHPGEIAPLSRLVAPAVAVLLNVHSAHAGNFADADALRLEKCSIAQGLPSDGTLVVNDLVTLPPTLEARGHLIRFGETSAAQVQLLGLTQQANETRANYRIFGQTLSARIPGGGKHRAQTLGAVLAVLHALGLDLAAATELPDALVPKGRGNLVRVQGRTLLDDSYNANPQSMRATLSALVDDDQHGAKRYALLGEMLELGEESAPAHASLAEYCRQLDGVWLVGDAMQGLVGHLSTDQCLGHWRSVQSATAAHELLEAVAKVLQPEDVLLVKGSQLIFWQQNFVEQLSERLSRS